MTHSTIAESKYSSELIMKNKYDKKVNIWENSWGLQWVLQVGLCICSRSWTTFINAIGNTSAVVNQNILKARILLTRRQHSLRHLKIFPTSSITIWN